MKIFLSVFVLLSMFSCIEKIPDGSSVKPVVGNDHAQSSVGIEAMPVVDQGESYLLSGLILLDHYNDGEAAFGFKYKSGWLDKYNRGNLMFMFRQRIDIPDLIADYGFSQQDTTQD